MRRSSLAAAMALAVLGTGVVHDQLWRNASMARSVMPTDSRPHKVSRTNSHKQNARRKKGSKS